MTDTRKSDCNDCSCCGASLDELKLGLGKPMIEAKTHKHLHYAVVNTEFGIDVSLCVPTNKYSLGDVQEIAHMLFRVLRSYEVRTRLMPLVTMSEEATIQ